MDSDGRLTDDDWAQVYGAGGASPVPSYLSTHYRRSLVRRSRLAPLWIAAVLTLVFWPLVIGVVPAAVVVAWKGQRWALAAGALSAVLATVGLLVGEGGPV